MAEQSPRGRHRILSDEVILAAALRTFADEGYEAMSVRHLNAELGLSHETIRQRFGAKRQLFFATVDFAVADFFRAMAIELESMPPATNDLEELRRAVRAYVTTSMKLPQLSNLINHESTTLNERMEYIFNAAFVPGMQMVSGPLEHLVAQGVVHPITVRDAFFLVRAGMAPFTQRGLSQAFDSLCGPLDEAGHVDHFLDVFFRGLMR